MGLGMAPERWKRVERIVLLAALVMDEAAKLITAIHRKSSGRALVPASHPGPADTRPVTMSARFASVR